MTSVTTRICESVTGFRLLQSHVMDHHLIRPDKVKTLQKSVTVFQAID